MPTPMSRILGSNNSSIESRASTLLCPRPRCLLSLSTPATPPDSRGWGRPGPRPGAGVSRGVGRRRADVGTHSIGRPSSRHRQARDWSPPRREKASAVMPLPSRVYRHRRLFSQESVTSRLIGCLYSDAQARMVLADLIRYFSAYEWMQSNDYKMTYFASAHAACVFLVQATKQELRQSQRIRWSKMRRCG
jgi:hypothetical protein